MENETNTALVIGFSVLAVFSFIIIIILLVLISNRKMILEKSKNQILEQKMQIDFFKASVEAEERLKEKIAKNLHDGINPGLALLKYSLTRHQSDFLENTFSGESLEKDKDSIDKTIQEIRSACYDLIPSGLYDFGLLKSLEHLIEAVDTPGTIRSEFVTQEPIHGLQNISIIDQVNIYRVCQELLNNLLKHAKCKAVKLSLYTEYEKLKIVFDHNGIGISNEDIDDLSKKGLGMKSLKTRVLILNGTLDYFNVNGGKIVFQLPLSA